MIAVSPFTAVLKRMWDTAAAVSAAAAAAPLLAHVAVFLTSAPPPPPPPRACVCVCQVEGRWYQCDDAWIVPVEVDTVKRCQAYMLYYKRKFADGQA